MSFKNKVVIITGASSGIGAATAVAFAKEGASVVITGENKKNIRKVMKQCEEAGKKPLGLKSDVMEDDGLRYVVDKTIERFKKIDVLVNNAGILRYGNLRNDTLLETYDEVIETNVRPAVVLTTYAAPHLIASKGNIVNISAIDADKVVCDEYIAFSVSKAALSHFTRAAAIELGAHGVRVNTVSPAEVRTNMYKNAGKVNLESVEFKTVLNAWAEPEEIADLILFVASDKARGITGSNLVCDNGSMLL